MNDEELLAKARKFGFSIFQKRYTLLSWHYDAYPESKNDLINGNCYHLSSEDSLLPEAVNYCYANSLLKINTKTFKTVDELLASLVKDVAEIENRKTQTTYKLHIDTISVIDNKLIKSKIVKQPSLNSAKAVLHDHLTSHIKANTMLLTGYLDSNFNLVPLNSDGITYYALSDSMQLTKFYIEKDTH